MSHHYKMAIKVIFAILLQPTQTDQQEEMPLSVMGKKWSNGGKERCFSFKSKPQADFFIFPK